MSLSMTLADYFLMAAVIVPCLFFMCFLPLIAYDRQARRPQQRQSALEIEDRDLRQIGGEDAARTGRPFLGDSASGVAQGE